MCRIKYCEPVLSGWGFVVAAGSRHSTSHRELAMARMVGFMGGSQELSIRRRCGVLHRVSQMVGVLLAAAVMAGGCGGSPSSAETNQSTTIGGTDSTASTAGGTSTTRPTNTSAQNQTADERQYQLDTQASAAVLMPAEELMYECLTDDSGQVAWPPNFTEANKAAVTQIAQQADEIWTQWEHRQAPSATYALLHDYNLQYLQHFAQGTRLLEVGFANEDLSVLKTRSWNSRWRLRPRRSSLPKERGSPQSRDSRRLTTRQMGPRG